MTIKRWAAKRDANEPEIVDVLTAMGCTVERQDGGCGRPDLKVSHPRLARALLIEVKMPGARLNAKQKAYHAASEEPIWIAHSVTEAIDILAWGLANWPKV